MNGFLAKLDEIVLSDNVVERFYAEYNENSSFKNKLDEVLPEIRMCDKQQQNNPWHKYNVLGHILHSVEEMNNQTKELGDKTRRMLAYVMLFHDIGKPAKHIVRNKGGVEIDSFFNHNIESAKVARRVLPMLGFIEDEVKIMDKLIYKHDIFMFIRERGDGNKYHRVLSEKLVREEIKELDEVGDGLRLMRFLVMIGRADNLAQNEEMTVDSLRLLVGFDKILDYILME